MTAAMIPAEVAELRAQADNLARKVRALLDAQARYRQHCREEVNALAALYGAQGQTTAAQALLRVRELFEDDAEEPT